MDCSTIPPSSIGFWPAMPIEQQPPPMWPWRASTIASACYPEDAVIQKMKVPAPVLRTERLWLDSPVLSQRFAVAEHCRDPFFANLMALPWSSELWHADFFLYRALPGGWLSADELTWALRTSVEGPLIGVIGVIGKRRVHGDIGF